MIELAGERTKGVVVVKFSRIVVGLVFFIAIFFGGCNTVKSPAPVFLTATNESYQSAYAEGDNINIPISGVATSFLIEATHPSYNTDGGSSDPDFSGGSSVGDPVYYFTPGTFKLLDNGTAVLDAVREKEWWRPNGMSVSVNSGAQTKDIHYLRLYRKIAGVNSWPQFLVLYQDGNLRLKPYPKDTNDNCFGSSVVIGPAVVAKRPISEISSVNYVSAADSLKILYKDASTATLTVVELNRTRAVVKTSFDGKSTLPLLTFRSMFVKLGNNDVDSIKWKDTTNIVQDNLILDFKSGESKEWLFYRKQRSEHNTAAPDIKIGIQE